LYFLIFPCKIQLVGEDGNFLESELLLESRKIILKDFGKVSL